MNKEVNNPFLLTKKEGPKVQQLAKILTKEEQAEKLIGYLEIDKEFWPQIRYGTHIRYYTTNGDFRTGGFVVKNPLEIVNPTDKKIITYIKLQNGFNDKANNYANWIANYEDLSKIYIKPDAGILTTVKSLEGVVTGLNDNIKKLVKHAKSLEERIEKLESKIKH